MSNTLETFIDWKPQGQIHKIDPSFLQMFNMARYAHWDDFKNFDVTKNRQDQLQGMIDHPSDFQRQVYFHQWVCNKIWYDDVSMEQLWLAFVMHELHSKRWIDEKWVKS